MVDLCLSRYICLHCNRLAPIAGNLGNDAVGTLFAGGVVDNNRCSLSRQVLGDGGTDPLRCAGHNSYFVLKFFHLVHSFSETMTSKTGSNRKRLKRQDTYEAKLSNSG